MSSIDEAASSRSSDVKATERPSALIAICAESIDARDSCPDGRTFRRRVSRHLPIAQEHVPHVVSVAHHEVRRERTKRHEAAVVTHFGGFAVGVAELAAAGTADADRFERDRPGLVKMPLPSVSRSRSMTWRTPAGPPVRLAALLVNTAKRPLWLNIASLLVSSPNVPSAVVLSAAHESRAQVERPGVADRQVVRAHPRIADVERHVLAVAADRDVLRRVPGTAAPFVRSGDRADRSPASRSPSSSSRT